MLRSCAQTAFLPGEGETKFRAKLFLPHFFLEKNEAF